MLRLNLLLNLAQRAYGYPCGYCGHNSQHPTVPCRRRELIPIIPQLIAAAICFKRGSPKSASSSVADRIHAPSASSSTSTQFASLLYTGAYLSADPIGKEICLQPAKAGMPSSWAALVPFRARHPYLRYAYRQVITHYGVCESGWSKDELRATSLTVSSSDAAVSAYA